MKELDRLIGRLRDAATHFGVPDRVRELCDEAADALTSRSAIDQALALSREEIIEECAKVADDMTCSCCWREDAQVAAESIAAAIRALVHSTGVPSEQSASSKDGTQGEPLTDQQLSAGIVKGQGQPLAPWEKS